MLNEETENTNTDYTPVHCSVAHPDAGGPCSEPFAVKVYGLNFCEIHGEEARRGSALESGYDAENYFRRQKNPEVVALPPAVLGGLEAAISNVRAGQPSEEDYDRALVAAYSNAPQNVRERISLWERDEEHGYLSVIDVLLSSLQFVHKLQRIAYEEGETWLVEMLERERESTAAQTAVALENTQKQLEEWRAERKVIGRRLAE